VSEAEAINIYCLRLQLRVEVLCFFASESTFSFACELQQWKRKTRLLL